MAGELGARRMKRVADSDSDEDAPVPAPANKGKSRANGAIGNAAAGPSNANGAARIQLAEDDDGPGWTTSDYEPRPIVLDQRLNEPLRKMIAQIAESRNALTNTIEKSSQIAVVVEQSRPGDKLVDQIDKGVRQTLDQMKALDFRLEVLESMKQKLRAGVVIQHPIEEYEQDVKVKVDQWNAKSERAKFKDDEDYKTFREGIWEATNGHSACPPVSRWLDAGPDDEDNSDDEIEVGGRTQTFRCPLSLGPLKDAVTSIKCKHSYSRDAIMGVMKKKGRGGGPASVACPVPGCKVQLTAADLVDDPKLQKKADDFARMQATQNEADVSMAISVAGDDDDDEDA